MAFEESSESMRDRIARRVRELEAGPADPRLVALEGLKKGRKLKALGRGAFGSVWVENSEKPESVIKIFNNPNATQEQRQATMISELRNMVRASIQVRERKTEARVLEPIFWTNDFDESANEKRPAIVMNYAGSATLFDVLRFADPTRKEALLVKVVNQVVRMDMAGYRQTDLKPENVFISEENEVLVGDAGSFSFALRGVTGERERRYPPPTQLTEYYWDPLERTQHWGAVTETGLSDGSVDGLLSSLYAVGKIFTSLPSCFFNGAPEPAASAPRLDRWCYAMIANKRADRFTLDDILSDAEIQEVARNNGVTLPHLKNDEGLRRSGEGAAELASRTARMKERAKDATERWNKARSMMENTQKELEKQRREVHAMNAKRRLLDTHALRLESAWEQQKEKEESGRVVGTPNDLRQWWVSQLQSDERVCTEELAKDKIERTRKVEDPCAKDDTSATNRGIPAPPSGPVSPARIAGQTVQTTTTLWARLGGNNDEYVVQVQQEEAAAENDNRDEMLALNLKMYGKADSGEGGPRGSDVRSSPAANPSRAMVLTRSEIDPDGKRTKRKTPSGEGKLGGSEDLAGETRTRRHRGS